MYCSRCGALNPDESSYCAKCGNVLKADNQILSISRNEKKGTFEQFDIISEDVEKLGFFYKLGFYIEGFFVLLIFSIYTFLIGPIIVYFWGKRGWPKNSLVKAVLYSRVIFTISLLLFILFVPFSLLAFNGTEQNQFEVSEAIGSKEKVAGKIISVNGSLVNNTDQWDKFNNTLQFKMTDGLSTINVVYEGEKPDIQNKDIQIRTTGKFEGNIFKAQDIWIMSYSRYYKTTEK
ncbi:MAG: zinc-ribbon domain-containing protein [Candidatus Methanoperedens sp.]|nr:zinc-ribbon domain-containing protein [Candidatus Methanoperedens sp.]